MPRTEGWLLVLRDALLGIVLIAVLWLTASPPEGAFGSGSVFVPVSVSAPVSAWRVLQISLAVIVLTAVLLRKRYSALAVFVAVLATGTAWTLGMTYDPFVMTGWCVLVLAERRGVRAAPWWMIAIGAALLMVALGLGAEGIQDRLRGMLLGAVVLSTAWILGVRTREARSDAAERSRTEERLRLARDVHDVLSHSLGAIGVRAGVTAHVRALSEDELREALREIEQDARSSLAELKTLLQQERASTSSTSSTRQASTNNTDAEESASASLGEALADLARTAQRAGIRTTLELSGKLELELNQLPADVRTTLYRVAQEAMTNVIRHAAASSATITVTLLAGRTAGRRQIQLEVRDDGAGPAGILQEGHGLTGIRERVAMLGGTVLIGAPARVPAPAVQPGFAVNVTLPLSLSLSLSPSVAEAHDEREEREL